MAHRKRRAHARNEVLRSILNRKAYFKVRFDDGEPYTIIGKLVGFDDDFVVIKTPNGGKEISWLDGLHSISVPSRKQVKTYNLRLKEATKPDYSYIR